MSDDTIYDPGTKAPTMMTGSPERPRESRVPEYPQNRIDLLEARILDQQERIHDIDTMAKLTAAEASRVHAEATRAQLVVNEAVKGMAESVGKMADAVGLMANAVASASRDFSTLSRIMMRGQLLLTVLMVGAFIAIASVGVIRLNHEHTPAVER